MNRKTRFFIIDILFPLSCGGLIYILFRDHHLLLHQWFEIITASSEVLLLRNLVHGIQAPAWFIYSLPDGLFVYSFICAMLLIWNMQFSRTALLWICIAPAFSIGHELLQYFHIISGTFDPVDIFFYSMFTALALIKPAYQYMKRSTP